jgi:N-acetylglucosamine-6-sulfatase
VQPNTNIGRVRHIVLVLVATVIAAMALGASLLAGDEQRSAAQTAESPNPNFVVVMTDDLDKKSMNQLDGIRAIMGSNGITFKNAYVTYSLCCPSRATFLRGQYPHNHGIIRNRSPLGGEGKFRELGLDQSTIATWLHDANYQTGYIGKYLNEYNDLYRPPDWDEWFVLQGESGGFDPNNIPVNDNGQSGTLTDHSTDVFAQEASDFIRSRKDNPDPFFLFIGTTAPHGPPDVAERYQGSFADTLLPRPPNFDEEDISDKPQWLKSSPRLSQDQVDNLQRQHRERLRSMLSVEDLLRQTITTLQETSELANTYIVFTSDNGYHMGNHRLYPASKETPYEEDIGVPLMVRGPGVPAGAVRKQLVLNNDFAPTLADLAGASIPKPEEVDGSSFAPLLTTSPPSSWRTAFLKEGWEATGVDPTVPIPTHKSVHTQRYMFTEYDTGEHELYDLSTDPYQLESMSRTTANEQLYDELQARLDALRDCSGEGCRSAEGFPDTTPPKVSSTSPATIATTANVTATFSEDMMASSITTPATTFKLVKLNADGTTTKVTATVSYNAATKEAILDPATNLSLGATYKATVTSGAQDLAGNALDQNPNIEGNQNKSWKFTVQ